MSSFVSATKQLENVQIPAAVAQTWLKSQGLI